MLYLRLFWEFFKTGLFSIGGGLATIPFLQEMSAKTGWFTYQDLADMIAVAESTPGPLGVNMATYVGFTTGSTYGVLGSFLGSVVATLGLITPCIIIICIIAYFLEKFRHNKYVDAAFYGLRAASVGLISAAGVSIILIAFFNASSIYDLRYKIQVSPKHLLLAVVIFVLTRYVKPTKKLHPIVFIAASALIGVIFGFAI